MVSKGYRKKRIGIIGGGQLGRMLIQAGLDFDVEFWVLDNDVSAPCSTIAHHFSVGDIRSYDAVLSFGSDCDIITIEIENINVEALFELEKMGKTVYPSPKVIELIQDKSKQKKFLSQNGINTASYQTVEHPSEIKNILFPAFFKLAKGGYDGKGVWKLNTQEDISFLPEAKGIIEQALHNPSEISVIVARDKKGNICTYPAVDMVFYDGHNLLKYLACPSIIPEDILQKADSLAIEIASKLSLVGILAVEMFVTNDGLVYVNEMAPRPHNSGHQTIEANYTSQYQQLIRILLGFPLGDTGLRSASLMLNVLGAEGSEGKKVIKGLESVLTYKGVYFHDYAKQTTKPLRKMGHITLLGDTVEELYPLADTIQEKLKIISDGN